MLDFDAIITKHGEAFIHGILENWEKFNSVYHVRPMMLEERWTHFLRETGTPALDAAA